MTREDGISLAGLDGSNPLAFLAALGTLNAASQRVGAGGPQIRLNWRDEGVWRPRLLGLASPPELVQAVVEDQTSWRGAKALQLRYGKVKKGESKGKQAHDLKPPPEVFREFARQLVSEVEGGRASRHELDMIAAYGSDAVTDNQGNLKPTALHFTAGQQEFLAMVDELAREVTSADIEEALFGPWRYERELPVLQWDSAGARDYALRAGDPSKEKKAGIPGADWLAFRGLPLIRTAPVGQWLRTTCCGGGWKDGFFEWPLWTAPLTRDVVQVVLGLEKPHELRPEVRRARGISAVFRSSISRHPNGGRGSFMPAEAL